MTLCAVLLVQAELAEFRLVDQVVAEVGESVITLSELQAETALTLLRTGGRALVEAYLSRPTELGLRDAVLRNRVLRELLAGESNRLQLREVPDAEVRAELRKLFDLFGTAGDAQRVLERVGFSVDPNADPLFASPGLVATVRAELQVERFVELRIQPLIRVDDAALLRCFEGRSAYFAGRALDEVRPFIEAQLREEQQELALRALLFELLKKTAPRFAPGFEQDIRRALVRAAAEGADFRCLPVQLGGRG
jgi:hypothetical protein